MPWAGLHRHVCPVSACRAMCLYTSPFVNLCRQQNILSSIEPKHSFVSLIPCLFSKIRNLNIVSLVEEKTIKQKKFVGHKWWVTLAQLAPLMPFKLQDGLALLIVTHKQKTAFFLRLAFKIAPWWHKHWHGIN